MLVGKLCIIICKKKDYQQKLSYLLSIHKGGGKREYTYKINVLSLLLNPQDFRTDSKKQNYNRRIKW